MDPNIEYIELDMICEVLADVPEFALPQGYALRFATPEDGQNWALVEAESGEFGGNVQKAHQHFMMEFAPHPEELSRRMIFLQTDAGEPVGTASAWYKEDWDGKGAWGRLHFVAIRQAWQGRGLALPLVAEAMRTLKKYHDRAYLDSQTSSWRALNLYKKFGFVPHITTPEQKRGWALVEEKLRSSVRGK